MSVANALQQIDATVLETLALITPLEFPDNTIQTTAYTGGGGIPTLEEVLTAGDDAQNLNITGVDNLDCNSVVIDTAQGQGNWVALQATDNTGVNGIYVLPNADDNYSNPIVNAGDCVVTANSSTQSFTLTTDSATTGGIRISDSSMLMGAGGATDTPSQRIEFNNPLNTIKATTTQGFYASSSTIQNNPTLAVEDVTTGQQIYMLPRAIEDSYNKFVQVGEQEIVGYGTAGINTQTLNIVPWSNTTCGLKLAPTSCKIGCGGNADAPTNSITFASTGTVETGQSHQFSNGVAQYSAVGNASRIIPSCPSTSATVVPCFEILNYHLTGNSPNPSATMSLQHNISATTNYSVFPSVYYGFSGSSGTHNATATSNAIDTIVITSITATQFSWIFNNNATGDNFNVYLSFLVVYNMPNTTYPKAY